MPKITGKIKTAHDANGAVPQKPTVKIGTKVGYAPAKAPLIPPKEPLWRGPEVDGTTFSLLSKFISCRERFRLLVVEGLKEAEGFSLRLEYGNMVHACEEATAAKKDWKPVLYNFVQKLVKKFGNKESATIDHWYKVCCAQYPVYLEHWRKHPDVVNRKPMFQEKPFDIPYKLPSGRIVRLRGKYDAGDVISKKLYIQENKARGNIQPDKMLSELLLDLQTGIYLTAADEEFRGVVPIGGCRYNVLRRPLSGGKYSIKQLEGRGKAKKGAETPEQYYARLQGLIKDDPQHFFFRWKIEVIPGDIKGFQNRILNPWLEQLSDWWEWISVDPFNPWISRPLGKELLNKVITPLAGMPNRIHWIHPSGVWNPTMEERISPYDEYILTGSDRGLLKTDNLYPELEKLDA